MYFLGTANQLNNTTTDGNSKTFFVIGDAPRLCLRGVKAEMVPIHILR